MTLVDAEDQLLWVFSLELHVADARNTRTTLAAAESRTEIGCHSWLFSGLEDDPVHYRFPAVS
jgi:hypothetical protein